MMTQPNDSHPAFDAISQGDLASLRKLVDADPDLVSFCDSFGDTLLLTAIDEEQVEIVRFLIAEGADPDVAVNDGYTCLLTAVESDTEESLEIVRLLIAAGASTRVAGTSGWTPLHMAAARGQLDKVRLLLDVGADVNQRTEIDGGNTPLMEAASQGHAKVVRLLLEAAAETMIRNDITGHTAIEAAQHAAIGPDPNVYKMLRDEPQLVSPNDVLDEIVNQMKEQTDVSDEVVSSMRRELENYDAAASYAEAAKRTQLQGDFETTIRLLANAIAEDSKSS